VTPSVYTFVYTHGKNEVQRKHEEDEEDEICDKKDLLPTSTCTGALATFPVNQCAYRHSVLLH